MNSSPATSIFDMNDTNSTPDETVVWSQSPVMRKMLQMAERIAKTRRPLLINGPTGSGKEVLAREIHRQSDNAVSPFIAVNCAAIPESLFESELFGHERGAFTGATQSRDGYMSAVGDGTLLLDEIGDLPLDLQTKLLRVLETNTFTPVGATAPRRFRGRILSATHKDMEKMVGSALFREDLFHRLSVFVLTIPCLKERREDIPLLVKAFSMRQPRQLRFTDDAMKSLSNASWPGNIRQLRNTIDRIAVLSDEDPVTRQTVLKYADVQPTEASDVIACIVQNLLSLDIENLLVSVEYSLIDEALRKHSGNKSKAAKMLGVHRKTVERRIITNELHWNDINKNYVHAKRCMLNGRHRDASIVFKSILHTLTKVPFSPAVEDLKLETLVSLSVCLRTLNGWKNPELSEIYRTALPIARRLDRPASLATIFFGLWASDIVDLELDTALGFAEEYLAQGKKLNSAEIISSAHIAIANCLLWQGNASRCREVLNDFQNSYRNCLENQKLQGLDLYVYNLMFHSVVSFQMGNISSTLKARDELEALAATEKHSFTAAIALGTCAWISFLTSEWKACRRFADAAVTLSEQNAFCFYHGFGLLFQGYIIARDGDISEGVRIIQTGRRKMFPCGGDLFNTVIGQMLGEIFLDTPRQTEGLRHVETSIARGRQRGELLYLSELLTLRARYHRAVGENALAEEDIHEAISIARKLQSRPAEQKALFLLDGFPAPAQKAIVSVDFKTGTDTNQGR